MSIKALLLGAGFSYDLGMPLAKDVTEDFFTFFDEGRIKSMISNLKNSNPYGDDNPISKKAMEDFFCVYKRLKKESIENNNYELFIKGLQDCEKELGIKPDVADMYNLLISKFNQYLNMYFWIYQINGYQLLKNNSDLYKWLLEDYSDEELWILSLNHDLNIEMMCIDYKIPLSFGYRATESYPLSNIDFTESVELDIQNRENLHIKDMSFIEGRKGVNLIKLHGAINEYRCDDNKKRVIASIGKCKESSDYFSIINTINHRMKYYFDENPSFPFLLDEEIPISDSNKKYHILKQSVLSGGYKYSETINHRDGEEKMDLLDEVLNKVDEVAIIGYSFGDSHINNRIVKAMYKNEKLRVEIIDPGYNKVPEVLNAFNYNFRVTACVSSVPDWVYFTHTGKWSEEIKNRLIKTEQIRKEIKKRVKRILTKRNNG